MQTRRRISERNISGEPTIPKVTRSQKRTSDSVQGVKKDVRDLITSSARKQKPAGSVAKKNVEPVGRKNLKTGYVSLQDEISDASSDYATASGASVSSLDCNAGTDIVSDTIFSPSFHVSKISGGDATGEVDFIKFFRTQDQNLHEDSGNYSHGDRPDCQSTQKSTIEEEICYDNALASTDSPGYCDAGEVADLPSEVSAIYLAMKNSDLECIDEQGQHAMSADVCMDDESEEYDDFDPYYFIKNLPELSSVIPTFRPVLLPKQTRSCPRTTLVLDLDETLVHSTLEPCDDSDFTFPVMFNSEEHIVYVRCRPYLTDFLERVSSLFEIIIFTASQSIYASQLLNVIDPKKKFFRHRVYRESCVFVDGNYLKDLSVLGRDLAQVIIIDNSPQAFGFQVDNGIPIESWYNDPSDQELLQLVPFLESLVGVEDVRPLIANKFNLRQRIAAAPYSIF